MLDNVLISHVVTHKWRALFWTPSRKRRLLTHPFKSNSRSLQKARRSSSVTPASEPLKHGTKAARFHYLQDKHKNLRKNKRCKIEFVTPAHATKFEEIINQEVSDAIPSKEDLNNDNLELFFVKCWEEGSKTGVLQARKWINHCLTKYGRPPLNKMARQHYASVLDTLTGMSKTEEWRDYVSEGAVSRTFCFALAVEFISLETCAVCIAYIVC